MQKHDTIMLKTNILTNLVVVITIEGENHMTSNYLNNYSNHVTHYYEYIVPP